MVPMCDRQAPLQLPAATGLPGKPVWQANAYFRSAAWLGSTRSQRSDGAVVLISSIYSVLSPNNKASGCTLRMLHVGIAHSHASTAQRRCSGAHMFNLLLSEPYNQGVKMLFAHLLRTLREAAQSPRGPDTACDSTGCIEQ